MNTKAAFFDRLRYGKHKFINGDEAYARPHTNPDGTIGGWVAETATVDATCWVAETAEVKEYAQVAGGAKVLGEASVSGFARINGPVILDDWCTITDDVLIEGSALIAGGTILAGRSHVDHGIVDDDDIHEYLLQINKKIERKK
jgi:UDP-3-O-[3-hydroxymyristoyl] glucosamine N-acyltransferase